MRNAVLACLLIPFFIGCKSKTTLDSEDAKYVRTALDLIRIRAEFGGAIAARMKDSLAKHPAAIADDRHSSVVPRSPAMEEQNATDSVRFNASLDSVYRRDGISRQQFIDWTTQLADDPKRAAAFYSVLNDSMSGK